MTLCISYINKREGEHAHGFALADSQLTVIGPNTSEKAGRILPSNCEIRHVNNLGIKIAVIRQERFKKRDIIVSIAGAISLGLHSIMYLQGIFRGLYNELSFMETINLIEVSIQKFWKTSFDQDIEYLFMLFDDNGILRLFTLKGGNGNLKEIEPIDGILLGVIGDNADLIKQQILGSVGCILIDPSILVWSAVEISCVRALRKEIEDPDNLFVGGVIQAACLRTDIGGFLQPVMYNNKMCFSIVHGKLINLTEFPLLHGPPWSFGTDIYDPNIPLSDIVGQLPTVYQFPDAVS